jgi:ribosomal protein L31
MIYRNRRLLNLAHRVNDCQFLLPGCQGYSVEGCEPAHSNQSAHGKGGSIKAADDQHVAACPHCHRFYDGQTGSVLLRSVAVERFNEGRARTFSLYEKNGWLVEVGYVLKEAA